jgi:hypothetical protein
MEQFDVAARRETCRWELPFREKGFAALLPHLQGMRDLSRLLALRAKLHLAEGNFEEAARAMATGFAAARDTGRDGVLIESLVAVVCARNMGQAVRDWQQTAAAPSLYWSLAEVPRPFVNISGSLRYENLLPYVGLPALGAARDRRITSEQWRTAVHRIAAITRGENPEAAPGIARAVEQALDAATILPKARQYLIQTGTPRDVVEAMPPLEAVAIYQVDEYERVFQEMQKWFALPYWQARAGLAASIDEYVKAAEPRTNMLLGFVPAMNKVFANCVIADRGLAALQTVEALRGYAAAHQGKLPATLEELDDFMPAPLDPMTGRNFDYVPGDGGFTLQAAPMDERGGIRYEVTIK